MTDRRWGTQDLEDTQISGSDWFRRWTTLLSFQQEG